MVSAGLREDFERPHAAQPMLVDLHLTVQESGIVRLLILLARVEMPEPELRRVS